MVWEQIKDWLGVIDDAGDIVEELKKQETVVRGLFAKLDSAGSDVRTKLAKLTSIDRSSQSMGLLDPGTQGPVKEVRRIMDDLDIDRPLLWGRTLMGTLTDAQRTLWKLQTALARLPDETQNKLQPKIEKLRKEIDDGIERNALLLRIFSDTQQLRKAFYQRAVMAVVIASVLTALRLYSLYDRYQNQNGNWEPLGDLDAERKREYERLRKRAEWEKNRRKNQQDESQEF